MEDHSKITTTESTEGVTNEAFTPESDEIKAEITSEDNQTTSTNAPTARVETHGKLFENGTSNGKINEAFTQDLDDPKTPEDKQSSEDEKEKEEKKDEPPPVSILKLFKYSSLKDRFLIVIGCLVACVTGTAFPIIIYIMGDLLNQFVDYQVVVDRVCFNITSYGNISTDILAQNRTLDGFLEKCQELSIYMAIVGGAMIVCNFIMVSSLTMSAEKQAARIRHLFMRAILRQEMAWFDTHLTGDFSSRLIADLKRIQDGLGEKLGMGLYFIATMVYALGFAFYFGWKLTLVILSVMPILVIATGIIAKVQATLTKGELDAYGKAGAVAEEVISSIRTVIAFGGENKEIKRYESNLVHAKATGVKRGLATSVGVSLVWFCIYASYALAFWYGVSLILEEFHLPTDQKTYSPRTVIIVFFNVVTGAMNLGQAAPYFEAFAMARGAAAKIYSIIEREPEIDSSSNKGRKPSTLKGSVKFENVSFQYPARKDITVLEDFSLTINPGETVALVGPSGCGKSTVVQLLQRFYDTGEGQVLIDNFDVKLLNIGWLRGHIGVVGQEPALFATTIAENIRYGLATATQADIEQAAIAANAHQFISKLPKKYETLVGERGAQLSGGQKQRIAIARALVRNPRILLLDEATSALDSESEAIVQAALDKAREGRTTLIVAHRLSTIKNAEKIVVLSKGRVLEMGTHDELMKRNGAYADLVKTQVFAQSDLNEKSSETLLLERQLSTTSQLSVDAVPQKENESEDDPKDANPPQKRLLKLTTPEWPYVLIGCICAFSMGLSVPAYSILLGEIFQSLSLPNEDEIRSSSVYYSLLFLGIGVASGLLSFFQTYMFIVAGERLTLRLRRICFSAMLQQEMAWFDIPGNSTGALCARLSSDAAAVQGATGSRMSTVFQSFSTLIAGLALGLSYNWKLGLVTLSFVPLILFSTYLESRMISGKLLSDETALEEASKIAIEAIDNIRTVASLHQEQVFCSNYVTALAAIQKGATKKAVLRGISFGLSQCIPSLAYAVTFLYGSVLIKDCELIFGDLFKVGEGVILGTMMIGQAVAFAPDYHKAKIAAVKIFKLLDRVPAILSTGGKALSRTEGIVELKNVHFCYPTRPEAEVLRDLSLTVEPGKTIALVGSSGCGKSTCIQLLERFYDASGGQVCIDHEDVKNLDLAWLRSQLGIVAQEPVLFSCSISENIAYGDNSREVSMDEIILAAQKANIHNFISQLNEGYNTPVGDRGSQLSGGQKQRVAIARALIRNPKILLLDEATSALDAESEKVVQAALDEASVGRTCIIIAHRLSTIQNADQIYVIHKGKIVERGTHQELLEKRGFYYNLHVTQAGTVS